MRLSLTTLKGALNELAKTYREFKAKKIEPEEARVRTTILKALIDGIYKNQVEDELIKIKEVLDNEQRKNF